MLYFISYSTVRAIGRTRTHTGARTHACTHAHTRARAHAHTLQTLQTFLHLLVLLRREILISAELLNSDYLHYYGTVSYLQLPRFLGVYVQYL